MKTSTKAKILVAARRLFVAYGFAGTSMGQIAKAAEVTHSLLFHHYGNKQKLWVAVKQSIVDESNMAQQTLPTLNSSFKIFLKRLAKNTLRFYQNHPDIVRMIGWQRLEKAGESPAGKSITQEGQAWIDAFTHYQRRGELRADIPVEYAITFFVSLLSHVGVDEAPFLKDDKTVESYLKFCLKQVNTVLVSEP